MTGKWIELLPKHPWSVISRPDGESVNAIYLSDCDCESVTVLVMVLVKVMVMLMVMAMVMVMVMVVVMVMVTLIKMNDRCKRPLREKMETRRSLDSRRRKERSRLPEVISGF